MAEVAEEKEETLGQRQARLRREKRNARIASEGNDRLAKITQLSGRPAPAAEDAPISQKPNQASVSSPASAPDPDEIDISDHHYTPRGTPRPGDLTPFQQQQQQQQLAQMQQNPFGPGMMPPGFGGPNNGGANNPSGGVDPMMAMMQQMMGGAGGAGGAGGGFPMGDPNDPNNPMADLPPFMKQLLAAQNQTSSDTAAQNARPKSSSAYLWRVVHAVFAVALAAYIALTGTFNGTKLSRAESVEGLSQGPNLFYLFATVELVLQTSRYFLEKGQLGGTGWLATIANSGLVPEPYGGWVRVIGRYSVIWQTVVGDAMVVVFLLGVVAWWRGVGIA